MMMQMNQLICIALMSSFFLASASAMFKPKAQNDGWTAVYQLIDTGNKGHITESDLRKFFETTYGKQFDASARKGITDLVKMQKKGQLNKNTFIQHMENRSKQTTTLQAMQNAFPGQSSVLGRDLNRKFKLKEGEDLTFDPVVYYRLQDAADMIDGLNK